MSIKEIADKLDTYPSKVSVWIRILNIVPRKIWRNQDTRLRFRNDCTEKDFRRLKALKMLSLEMTTKKASKIVKRWG